MEVSQIIQKLLIAIKRQDNIAFNELQQYKAFANLQNIITGLYLCLRMNKYKYYTRLRVFFKITRESETQESFCESTKFIINNYAREELTEESENNPSQISENSIIYKHFLMSALEYAIETKEEHLLSVLVHDGQMSINSHFLYNLLKLEQYSIIKEIILDSLFISDEQNLSIDIQCEKPDLQLITKINSDEDIEYKYMVGDFIDFMIQNTFSELKINLFMAATKELGDYSVIPSLLRNKRELQAEKLLKEQYAFNDEIVLVAIDHKCFNFLLYYMRISDNELLEKEEAIIKHLLNGLKEDTKNMEIYLFILFKYHKYLSQVSSSGFLSFVNESLHSNDSTIYFLEVHPNPIKICILLSELIILIKKDFASLAIKCERIGEEILELTRKLQDQIDNESQMRQIFLDKDIDNRDLLAIIGINNLITLLENPIMQSLINDIWGGPYNFEANFVAASSSLYKLLFSGGKGNRDLEQKVRSKMLKRDVQKMKSHRYQFIPWKYGLHVRYIMETLTFLVYLFLNTTTNNFLIYNNLRHLYSHKPDLVAHIEGVKPISNELDEELDRNIGNIINGFMIVDAILLIFISLLFHYIYIYFFLKLTKRQVSKRMFFHLEFIVDFMAFFLAYRYRDFLSGSGRLRNLRESHDKGEHITIQIVYLIEIVDSKEFDYYSSLLPIINILRLFVAMRVNSIFGPFIKMIRLMIKSMLTFLILYVLNLLTFSVIGTIIMFPSNNNRFGGTYESFITLFQASLGVFTFDDIKDGNLGRYYNEVFMILFLLLNMVLLMNLLIAIISNIYAMYENRSTSLYMTEIVRMRNIYSNDEYYGCLISVPNPFSILNIIPLLIFILTWKMQKSREIHLIVNKIFHYIQYTLTFLIALPLYIILNAVLIPFVYLKWVIVKFKLICTGNADSTQRKIAKSIFYLIFGGPIIILYYFTDCIYFCIHLYANKPQHIQQTKKTDYISSKIFTSFLSFLELNINNYEIVPYKKLSSKLKELCNIQDINLLAPRKSSIPQAIIFSPDIKPTLLTPSKIKEISEKKRRTSAFLSGIFKQTNQQKMGHRQSTFQINELFVGQDKLKASIQNIYIDRILDFASLSILLKNLCIKNKDGIEIISLRQLYTILFSYLKMEELQIRRRNLAKQSKEKLLKQSTYVNKVTSVNENIENIEEKCEVEEFLSEHILMILLHTYQISQINKAIIFFKSESSQPLRIQALQRKIDILGLMMTKKLREDVEKRIIERQSFGQEWEKKGRKIQNKRNFQKEMFGISIYDEEIQWQTVNIRINKPMLSFTSDDLDEDNTGKEESEFKEDLGEKNYEDSMTARKLIT